MPPPAGPRIRAQHLKDDLRALGVLGPAEAAVRAMVRPATLAAIEEALKVEYLPAALKAELAEAVFAEAGEAGSRRWARQALLDSLKGFYQPLLRVVTAVADPTPTSVLRIFPRGWLGSYRDCGEFTVAEPAPGRTRMTVRGLPAVLRLRPFLAAFCGSFEATWEVTRYQGEVRLEGWGPDREEASWLLEWRRR